MAERGAPGRQYFFELLDVLLGREIVQGSIKLSDQALKLRRISSARSRETSCRCRRRRIQRFRKQIPTARPRSLQGQDETTTSQKRAPRESRLGIFGSFAATIKRVFGHPRHTLGNGIHSDASHGQPPFTNRVAAKI